MLYQNTTNARDHDSINIGPYQSRKNLTLIDLSAARSSAPSNVLWSPSGTREPSDKMRVFSDSLSKLENSLKSKHLTNVYQ